MRKIQNKPSREEKQLATDMQAPFNPPVIEQETGIATTEWQARGVSRMNTFKQLAKVSRSARLAFGSGNANWIRPQDLFNPAYRNGFESPPFYITRAFRFVSKGGYGDRLGIEIVMSNGRSYNVGFSFNEGDSKRAAILAMFDTANAEPMGPFCIKPLPMNKGNDYLDIVPYEPETVQSTEVDIPFVEIDDSDVPF
jgi:hypothetical protein